MSKNLLLSQPWYDLLGHLVAHIGDSQFHTLLISILKKVTPFEHTVIIAYPDKARPVHVYNDLPGEQIKPSLDTYFAGAYLLDPLYNACQTHLQEGYYRIRQLAPDEFYETEYYRKYYQGTRLKEEVGLIVEVSASLRVVISIGIRDLKISLGNDDLALLDMIWPLLVVTCRQHWRQLDLTPSEIYHRKEYEYRLGQPLDLAFKNFGRDHLSERECEIVHLVLKGHSNKSIAELLSISIDTVKAHRKHVHTKLQISSQTELFALFLDAISLVPMGSTDDPLTLYQASRAE